LLNARNLLLLCGLTGLVGLPFLDKPFHIDDASLLRIADNILANPLDPFAGEYSWRGVPESLWKMVTNPPLLSYLLAPVAGLSNNSEVALHALLLPFTFLFGAACLWLGRRFSDSPWGVVLFVMTSAGVVVSGNIMRDVPAGALSAASIALCVAGTDRAKPRLLLLAALLAGLTILMKYSAVILLPLLVLYPLLKRRFAATLWVLVPLAMVGLFSLHNLWVYGETQIGLLLGRSWGASSWVDVLVGLPVVAGSLLYFAPLLVASALRQRGALQLGLPVVLLAVLAATQWLLSGYADFQYLFWSLCGAAMLYLCLAEGLRGALPLVSDPSDAQGTDSLFLFAWLCAPLFFAAIFSPFQAVRHLIPALLPLSLLAFRTLEHARAGRQASVGERRALVAVLAVQASVAFAVAFSDYEHAAAYRTQAERVASRLEAKSVDGWYIGHWGWYFYAENAGLRELHPEGPFPKPGDLFVQPQNYYNRGLPTGPGAPAFTKLETSVFEPTLPIRAMHPAGAGFYAMYSIRKPGLLPSVPYRITPNYPVEVFETYVATEPRRSP
jgi:hypothetical protein